MKHESRRGERSTMAAEVRRRRRNSRREGWRIVLSGKPTDVPTNRDVPPGPPGPPGPPPGVLARLAVVWPRQFYRQLELRWTHAPSDVLFRALLFILILVFAGLIIGVAVLAALATGHAALDGLDVGIILSSLLPLAAVGYLCWGWLIDRFSQRSQGR